LPLEDLTRILGGEGMSCFEQIEYQILRKIKI
jgi:hypothetical protein